MYCFFRNDSVNSLPWTFESSQLCLHPDLLITVLDWFLISQNCSTKRDWMTVSEKTCIDTNIYNYAKPFATIWGGGMLAEKPGVCHQETHWAPGPADLVEVRRLRQCLEWGGASLWLQLIWFYFSSGPGWPETFWVLCGHQLRVSDIDTLVA